MSTFLLPPSFLFSIFVPITQKPPRQVFIAHVILGSFRATGKMAGWTEFTLIELSVGNPRQGADSESPMRSLWAAFCQPGKQVS